MEMESIMNFLMLVEPHNTKRGVLPILGQAAVGKSTLVAHVCNVERVCNYFTASHLGQSQHARWQAPNDPLPPSFFPPHGDPCRYHRTIVPIGAMEDTEGEDVKPKPSLPSLPSSFHLFACRETARKKMEKENKRKGLGQAHRIQLQPGYCMMGTVACGHCSIWNFCQPAFQLKQLYHPTSK